MEADSFVTNYSYQTGINGKGSKSTLPLTGAIRESNRD